MEDTRPFAPVVTALTPSEPKSQERRDPGSRGVVASMAPVR